MNFKKLLSMLLILCVITTSIGSQVYAKPLSIPNNSGRDMPKADELQSGVESRNKLPKPGEQPIELEKRRTHYSKEYLNPDGTFSVEVSTKPINYKDKNGNLKEIDNAFINSSKTGFDFENKANSFKVRLAKNNQSGDLVHYSIDEDRYLAFSPADKFSSIGIANNSSMEYKNIKSGMDLKYTIDSNMLKEEIILSQYPGTNTFTFKLKSKGLSFEKDSDGILWGKDKKTNEKLFQFQRPFATDSDNDITYDADLSITENNSKLVITVSDEWLHNAKYPVIIDPTIETTINTSIQDTYISSDNPDSEYYWSSYLHVGNLPGYGTLRSMIRFDKLPSLPVGAKITKAEIGAFMYLGSTNGTTVDVHEITQTWKEDTVNWNSNISYDPVPILSAFTATPNTEWKFDITSLATDWYNATSGNYGVLFKATNESNPKISFYSSEETTGSTPRLIINYEIDPLGIESYLGFDGNVNVFNGNLVVSETDVTLPGRGIPIIVSRTYNSRDDETTIVGNRWKLNVGMKIDFISDDESVVKLTEGDGSELYFGFKQLDVYQNKIYTSPTGINSTLIKDYATGEFILEEKSGTKYYFTTDGRLDKIVDTVGNTTDLFYNGDLTINRIQDPSGRVVNFNYSNEKLDTITGNEMPTVKYSYVGDNLTKVEIKKASGEVLDYINYDYTIDGNDNLEYVTDKYSNTTEIDYSYTAELGRRVYSIKKPLTIDGVLTYPTTYYTYNDNGSEVITTVTNPEGNITEYTTNYHGNVEKVINDKGGLDITALYEWDQQYNIIKVTNPRGKEYAASYTEKGDIARIVNPVGDIANSNYNTENDLVQSSGFAGESTKNYYDNSRHITGDVDAAYSTTVYNYNGNGNIVSMSNPIGIGENRVPNSGFESSSGLIPWRWTKEGTGDTIIHDTSEKINGKYSVKLTTTGTEENQKAILVSDYVEVTPDSKYNVSWYVKTATVGNNSGGATVDIRWYDSGYQLLETWGNAAASIDTQGIQNDWLRKGARVVSPIDAIYAKVVLKVNDIGTAWFDNVQFEYGPVINQYNILSNESFETDVDNDAEPDGWVTSGFSIVNGDGIVSNESHSGNNSVLINGASTNKFLYQKANLEGKTGTPIHISGWAKPEGVSPTGGDFSLLIQVVFKDGSPDGWYGFDFNKSGTDWEYKETEIRPAKDFSHIAIYAKFENQTGKAWFDDLKIRLNGSSHAFMSAYNMAENGSFELDADLTGWPDGWPVEHSVTPGTYNVEWVDKLDGWQGGTEISDDYKPYNGEKMLKMSDMPDEAKVTTFFFEEIEVNKTYSASALIKTENVSGTGSVVMFDVYDSSDVPLGQLTSDAITGTTEWTRVTLSASYDELKAVSVDAAKIKVGIGVAGATYGTMYFDTIRMWEQEIESIFEYDINDNYMTSVTNQLGNKIIIQNDTRGNLDGVTDAKNNIYDYEYDEIDRIKWVDNPQGLTSIFTYDSTPTINTLQIDNNDSSGYINTTIKVTYNELGLAKTVTDSNWRDTHLEYDKNANLTDIKYSDGNKIHYVYDNADRLKDISYTGDTTTWTFTYDANSNIKSEMKNGVTTSYDYDDLDRLKSIIYPQISGSSHNTTYGYNTVGQVTSIQHSPLVSDDVIYDYNLSGFNITVNGPNNSEAAFMYNEQSQLKKSWVGQAGNRHYLTFKDYDAAGNIIRIWTEDNLGNVISDLTYDEYDKNGNLQTVTDRKTGEYTKYYYDTINQLTKEEYYDSNDVLTDTIEYKYEGRDGLLGNRTGKIVTQGVVSTTTTYDYNTANEILSKDSDIYTHDQRGNLTSDGTRTYIYNVDNQLIEVKEGITTIAQYEYNAAGLRIKKVDTAASKTYHYYYDGNKLAYMTDGNNDIMYYFTRDAAGNLLNMIDYTNVTPQTYWYVFDGHRSVIGMVDKDGNKVVSYEYDAWGNITNTSSTVITGDGVALDVANPFRYSSYFYDEETGFYYLKARYYDADLGRFLSRDVVLSKNLYSYCTGNPVNLVDPDGLFWRAALASGLTLGGSSFGSSILGGLATIGGPLTWIAIGVGALIVVGVVYATSKDSEKDVGSDDENNEGTDNSDPTSPSQLQKKVEKGQAPREVDRVDKPHVPGQKPHVHFKDGTTLNNDGTIHDAHKGVPDPSNKTIKWLLENGWQIGE